MCSIEYVGRYCICLGIGVVVEERFGRVYCYQRWGEIGGRGTNEELVSALVEVFVN